MSLQKNRIVTNIAADVLTEGYIIFTNSSSSLYRRIYYSCTAADILTER
jgi:hypothetical protein